MKLCPLGDRVIVRTTEADAVTASGLVIPPTAQEKSQSGVIVAVGVGGLTTQGERIAPEIAPDDEVLFSKYGGTEIKVDGEDLLVLRESDILARMA